MNVQRSRSHAHPLEQLRDEALREIESAGDEQALEAARVKYLGRSGSISAWGEQMKTLGKEEKPIVGKLLNEVRNAVTAALEARARKVSLAKESGRARQDRHLAAGHATRDRRAASPHPDVERVDRNFPANGIRARRGPGHRRRMALLRRAQHPAGTSRAQRAGHILFARRPTAAHAYFDRANPHDASRAAADPRDRARRGLSSR